MQVVHIETRMQVMFGVLDDEGNVINQFVLAPRTQDEQGKPVVDPLLIKKLNKEAVDKAYEYILSVRAELAKNVNNQADNTEDNEG